MPRQVLSCEIVHERNTPYKIAEFEHLGADKTRTVETVRYAFKPTNSRPTEVRIAQINKLNFFLDLPDIAEGDGMLFMAFIRKSSGLSQAQYLTEKQISILEAIRLSLRQCMRR